MNSPDACCCYLLTPPGTGAIGIIRVLGSGSINVVAQVFQSKNGKPLTEKLLAGGRLRYGWIVEQGERIDDVLVSQPDIGGQETVDISAHGGIRIIERILGVLEAVGAVVSSTPLPASEVWQACNKIEADALDAMVQAKTERAVLFLGWQRQHLADHLKSLATSIEKKPDVAKIILGEMLATYEPARILIEGATVALVGPPNSGKSTLFNALLGREGAIVSDIAGTTRDWVSGDVEMRGVPIELIDTAGQRNSQDNLEQQAVAVGKDRVTKADVTVVVLDASETVSPSSSMIDALIEQYAGVGRECIVVLNKADLLGSCESDVSHGIVGSNGVPMIALSAMKLTGLEDFVELLTEQLGLVNFEINQPTFFTRRQAMQAKIAQDLLDRPFVAARLVREELIGSSEPILPLL